MAKATASQAALAVRVVVFGFDPDPGAAPKSALHVLTAGRALPGGPVETGERFAEAALAYASDAGVDLGGKRAKSKSPLHLVGLDDAPGRSRQVTACFYATAGYSEVEQPGQWAAVQRAPKLDAGSTAALKAALETLRSDTRHVAGATALLGDVFTGDDLLRLHVALHGGPEGSERTFRRRVQELRDGGVLKPVRDNEVAALRLRNPRFRSPAGTGGRPPELLRYAGAGGEDEQLAGLRARRSA